MKLVLILCYNDLQFSENRNSIKIRIIYYYILNNFLLMIENIIH